MKIYLEKSIFINRAPFEKIDLDFNENEVAVLSAVNGKGKTTILSHIVDAFYEMAKPHFANEFEGKENKFYRVSSGINNLNQSLPSFVYLRFKIDQESIDYLDVRNFCTEEQYNLAINIENKIPYSQFSQALTEQKLVKITSSNFNKTMAEDIFSNNILTYFPSYRHEQPGYLNEPYKVKLDFKKLSGFSGYLKNPIEVLSGLPQLANWIMDVVLDMKVEGINQSENLIFQNLNFIITNSLSLKNSSNLRFGIGTRNSGSSRIQIVENKNGVDEKQIYPTIFNLSSGEASIFCMFGELLKQADNYKNNIKLSEISGVVVVDEIDKHLHIRLQKEILPKLLAIFPNVQFIISSHSPFLSMGLAETILDRSKIIDLDNFGISKDPTLNSQYTEVYNMMISENQRFKEVYESLEQKIKQGTNPLIITEGKTDIQHLKKAKEKLSIIDLDVEFYEIVEDWGDSRLKLLLEQLSKIPQSRKVIGIFDRDVQNIIVEIEKDNQDFKDYTNNVYAFCIPIPESRKNYTNISIEFYYSDINLKTSKDDKSLYFDNELNFDSKRKPISKIDNPTESFHKKIWDENIGDSNFIHSKSRFAELVEIDTDFVKDFDFANFQSIFNKIELILNKDTEVVTSVSENTE